MSTNGPAEPPQRPLLPPRVQPLPELEERRAWALDALDALAEARGSRRRERGDSRFDSVYVAVVAVLIVAAMSGSLLSSLFARACGRGACSGTLGTVDPAASTWVGGAILLVTFGTVVLATRFFGPAGLPAATRWWIGASPAERTPLLRGPLAMVLLFDAVLGALGGATAALAASAGAPTVEVVGSTAALMSTVAVLVAELVGLAQGARWASSLQSAGIACIVLGVTGAAAVISPLAPRIAPLPEPALPVVLVCLVVGLAAAVATWPVLVRHLRHVEAAEICRGGEAAEAYLDGLLMLDSSVLGRLHDGRRRLHRASARSRPLRGRGVAAVMSAEFRRFLRGRTPAAVALAVLPLPVLAGGLAGPTIATVVTALGAVLVCRITGSGLRLATRSTAIRRMYPWSAMRFRLAHLAVPTAVTAVWTGAACLLAGLPVPTWPVAVLAASAATLRAAPEPAESMGMAAAQVTMTPMGAVPTGVLRLLSRGPDIAVVPVVLLLVHLPTLAVVVAASLAAWQLMRSERRT